MKTATAADLMVGFASRTGLGGDGTVLRYLWTDAFAVCNFLGLERSTGDGRHRELALRLVDQVHHTLGHHRGDDVRTGWLSGLRDQEAEAHPTRGGLRIGKPLPERPPNRPPGDQLEWDRDGQYFHYLTKWMHALDRVTQATGQGIFNLWARELAVVAHRAFTYVPRSGGQRQMYWKMSIDLSRPLVASMGQHDPLDGLVTYEQLDASALAIGSTTEHPSLADAIADFSGMIDRASLATPDPLGLGGILVDAFFLEQLVDRPERAELAGLLLEAALIGLSHYARQPDLRSSAGRRLAFRELGLAIGLSAIEMMNRDVGRRPDRPASIDSRIASLLRYLPLREDIESFWLQPNHRRVDSWLDHQDINEVMLATSLAPEGFLVRRSR